MRLAGKIDARTMQRLNHEVDGKHRDPGLVAREYLKSLEMSPADGPSPPRLGDDDPEGGHEAATRTPWQGRPPHDRDGLPRAVGRASGCPHRDQWESTGSPAISGSTCFFGWKKSARKRAAARPNPIGTRKSLW